MKYFKCVLIGCATSLLSGILYIVISSLMSFSRYSNGSFEEITTAFTAGPILLVVLLAGFVIGFFWMWKRASGSRLNT